jgi:DNA-directed RNA polymerase subunit alpha
MDGVLEDVTDILLNIKGVVLRMDGAEEKVMRIRRNQAGDVRASDIETDPAVTVANPDQLIATLTADVPFNVDMTVRAGRGYATAADNRAPEQELGVIPIDSVFSPVLRVRYRTEAMRVGQRTNYDRLILEIWTKGTVTPDDALFEAGLILRKHLNPLIMYQEMGSQLAEAVRPVASKQAAEQSAMDDLLSKPVSVLNLSMRASNCLEAAQIHTIKELVCKSEADLLRFRSFGKTSLNEVQRKLGDVGLALGMRLEDEGGAGPGQPMTGLGQSDSALLGGVSGSDDPSDNSAGPMEVYTMGE